MIPQQPLTPQYRPIEYPLHPDTSSLLVLFGMAFVTPIVLWALDDPIRVVGLAVLVGTVGVLARVVRRVRRDDVVHVPGTRFDVEIRVHRSGH